jgi:uncharacterized protein
MSGTEPVQAPWLGDLGRRISRVAHVMAMSVDELLWSKPGAGSHPPTVSAPEGVEVLGRDECLRLLERSSMGRVAFRAQARLMLLPVNYVMVRGEIVFRTSESATLAGPDVGSVVFEVDGVALLDDTRREAWSVVVEGVLRRVTGTELAALERLPLLEPWAPGPHPAHVRIEPEALSGRRFVIGSTASSQEMS